MTSLTELFDSVPTLAGKYIYTPLSKRSRIRILQVKPGAESDRLDCNLYETCLGDEYQIPYEALSYVWGSSEKTHSVMCGGLPLRITASLHVALRRFRWRDRPRVLWADAICINQDDVKERNAQVSYMQMVYMRAQRVLIWLGPRNVLDDGAYGMIKALVAVVRDGKPLSSLPPLWSRLRVFFQRPWFTRIWIVHEAGNASKGLVVWGHLFVDLQELLVAGRALRGQTTKICLDDGGRLVAYDQVNRGLNCLQIIRLWREGSIDADLLTWLYITRDLDATDPRDKVYWHYGNLRPSIRDQFPVDYSATVETIYRDLTVALLKRGNPILSFVSCFRGRSLLSLPSWVPDWSAKAHGDPFPITSRHFQAAGGKERTFSASDNILKIIGVLVDKITVLAPPFTDRDNLEGTDISKWHAHWNQWLTKTKLMTFRVDSYPTGENIETAYWKTLVCNTGSDGCAILDEFSAHFKAFKRWIHNSVHPKDPELENATANIQDDKDNKNNEDSGKKFLDLLQSASVERVFCTTRSGFMGWVPLDTQPEDLVCILFGSKYPYVIRPAGENYHMLIGESYIHGIMHGEALEMDGSEKEEFWLK